MVYELVRRNCIVHTWLEHERAEDDATRMPLRHANKGNVRVSVDNI